MGYTLLFSINGNLAVTRVWFSEYFILSVKNLTTEKCEKSIYSS